MITVREGADSEIMKLACGYSQKFFECPACGHDGDWVVGALSFCSECFADLIDVERLLEDEGYKIDYHFGRVEEATE